MMLAGSVGCAVVWKLIRKPLAPSPPPILLTCTQKRGGGGINQILYVRPWSSRVRGVHNKVSMVLLPFVLVELPPTLFSVMRKMDLGLKIISQYLNIYKDKQG